MASNFVPTLLARGQAAGPALIASSSYAENEVALTDIYKQTLHLQKRQAYGTIQNNDLDYVYSNSSSATNALASGGIVDIIVPAGALGGIVSSCIIELNVNNATGGACTLSPSPLLLTRIDVGMASGNQIVQTILGEHLWYATVMLQNEQWALLHNYMNTTVNWGIGTSLANGASITYGIPLLGTVFYECHFYGGTIQQDIRLRLYFNANAIEVGSMPSLTSAAARFSVAELPPNEEAAIRKDFAERDHQYKYLYPVVSTQLLTVASGGSYQWQLSGLSGVASHLFLTARATPVTGASIRTPVQLASYALLDPSSRNIIGGSQLTDKDARYWYPLRCGIKSQLQNNLFVYPIAMTKDVVASMQDGVNRGCYGFSSKEQMQVVNGTTTGSVQFDVYGYVYAVMTITRKGEILYTLS